MVDRSPAGERALPPRAMTAVREVFFSIVVMDRAQAMWGSGGGQGYRGGLASSAPSASYARPKAAQSPCCSAVRMAAYSDATRARKSWIETPPAVSVAAMMGPGGLVASTIVLPVISESPLTIAMRASVGGPCPFHA